MLAYTPTEPFDNKFHKLEIKVNRPGAHVYARQGYVATADKPRSATETREAAIVRAAMSPLAKREVDLAARLEYRFLPDTRAQVDINARLSYSMGFGTRTASPTQGPQIRVVRGDGGDPLRDMPGADMSTKKYGLELYVQAFNLINHVNALNFSGVLTSPFFGQPTSAAPPRRIELGMRLSF